MLRRLIVPRNDALRIQHNHAVLDGVKKRLQKIPLTRQPLQHNLQPLGIELINPAGNPVKKM